MVRRGGCVAVLALMALLGLAVGSWAAPAKPVVVVVGMSGVTWDDIGVGQSPNLHTLTSWSAAAVSPRTVSAWSCPDDGWLALSTGRRFQAPGRPSLRGVPTDCAPTRMTGNPVTGWTGAPADVVNPYRARPGLLGQSLAAAHVRAVGIGPGASVALAGPDGRVAGTWHSVAGDADLTTQVRRAVGQFGVDGGLLVVDLGDVPGAGSNRSDALSRVDQRFGQVLSQLPETADVIVVSLADNAKSPHLQIGARRPRAGVVAGLMTSPSTRQPGLVQVTDLAPTILTALGVAVPEEFVGSPLSSPASGPADAGARLRVLRDRDQAAQALARVIAPFVVIVYLPALLGYAWLWWGRTRHGQRWPLWVVPLNELLALVPAATYLANLVPWWRFRWPLLAVLGAVALATLVLALPLLLIGRLPRAGRRWFLVGYPAVATAAVLGLDLAGGSRLQLSSLVGVQPLIGGRFYGLGNPAFALLGTAALLLAAAIAGALLTGPGQDSPPMSRPRRIAAASILTVAVFAVAIDASPDLGADFGGPPALLPALVVLTLLVLALRLTWRRVALAALSALLVTTLVCLIDWLRPAAQRTHLGRAVQSLLDGELGSIIARKWATNWDLLTSTPVTVAIPAGTVLVGYLLVRPERVAARLGPYGAAQGLATLYRQSPVLRQLAASWLVMVAIAFFLNDSGAVVPPVGGALLVPVMIAAVVSRRVFGPSPMPTEAAADPWTREPAG